MENTQVLLNIVWTMVGAFLVYFMQAGFAMVETGFTRAKKQKMFQKNRRKVEPASQNEK